MSDADDAEELERIRERKREELLERARGESGEGGGAPDRPSAGDEAGAGSDATPAEPVHVEGGDHLEEIVERHDLVLVDFYADWCGPCQMLAPILDDLAAETPAAVAKVDADAHQPLAGRFGVQGLPTLLLFADGEPAERLVGMQDEATLRDLIERRAADG